MCVLRRKHCCATAVYCSNRRLISATVSVLFPPAALHSSGLTVRGCLVWHTCNLWAHMYMHGSIFSKAAIAFQPALLVVI